MPKYYRRRRRSFRVKRRFFRRRRTSFKKRALTTVGKSKGQIFKTRFTETYQMITRGGAGGADNQIGGFTVAMIGDSASSVPAGVIKPRNPQSARQTEFDNIFDQWTITGVQIKMIAPPPNTIPLQGGIAGQYVQPISWQIAGDPNNTIGVTPLLNQLGDKSGFQEGAIPENRTITRYYKTWGMYKRAGVKYSKTGDLSYYGQLPQDEAPTIYCGFVLAAPALNNSQLVGHLKVTYYVTYFN